jgi:hypothetical protein
MVIIVSYEARDAGEEEELSISPSSISFGFTTTYQSKVLHHYARGTHPYVG